MTYTRSSSNALPQVHKPASAIRLHADANSSNLIQIYLNHTITSTSSSQAP